MSPRISIFQCLKYKWETPAIVFFYLCILYLCIHDPPMYSLCMLVFHPGRQNSNIYQYSWALEFPYAYACSTNGPWNFLTIHLCIFYLWQHFILLAKPLRRRNSNIYQYSWALEFPYRPGIFLTVHLCIFYLWQYFIQLARPLRAGTLTLIITVSSWVSIFLCLQYEWALEFPDDLYMYTLSMTVFHPARQTTSPTELQHL